MRNEPLKILVIDSNRMFADGLRTMLMIRKRFGDPDIAVSSDEGLNLIAHQYYDLVITDMDLGDHSGALLARKIKENHMDTKVLVITTVADQEVLATILASGADAFLQKNSSPDEFFITIDKILGMDWQDNASEG